MCIDLYVSITRLTLRPTILYFRVGLGQHKINAQPKHGVTKERSDDSVFACEFPQQSRGKWIKQTKCKWRAEWEEWHRGCRNTTGTCHSLSAAVRGMKLFPEVVRHAAHERYNFTATHAFVKQYLLKYCHCLRASLSAPPPVTLYFNQSVQYTVHQFARSVLCFQKNVTWFRHCDLL